MRILVVGGGLSGLLAGFHLQCRGYQVELWEASACLGGWAQTLDWPGPCGEPGLLERGPQGVRWRRASAADCLLDVLGLRPCTPPTGARWIGLHGRRHLSPRTLGGLLASPLLTWGQKIRLLVEPLVLARGGDRNLEAFLVRRLGAGFTRAVAVPLVAGYLGAHPRDLAPEAIPELGAWEARGSLARGACRDATGWKTRHLPGGMGALAGALAATLAVVRTGRRGLALEPRAGAWEVLWQGGRAPADGVVLALPPREAALLLGALAPGAAALMGALEATDLVSVHTRHAAGPDLPWGFSLHLHPDEGAGVLGMIGSAKGDPRVPPGFLQARTYLALPPEEDAAGAAAMALATWLPELGPVVQVREERAPGGLPRPRPGHRERVERILEGLPRGIAWVSDARFGAGVHRLAEDISQWAMDWQISGEARGQ